MPLTLSPISSARTKNPNTPESDLQSTVPHIVTLADGNEIELPARDPLDAMNRVRKQQAELRQKSASPSCPSP